MIDLHCHSTASDGLLSPEEAAGYAAEKGLKVWALTDHDTTAGLEAAGKEAEKRGIVEHIVSSTMSRVLKGE